MPHADAAIDQRSQHMKR